MKLQRVLPFVFLFITGLTADLQGQEAEKQKGLDAITKQVLEAQLEFLASDWTEGRETGRKGAYMAADYIASMLKLYGASPAGDFKKTRDRWGRVQVTNQRSYFQEFPLIQIYPDYKAELRCLRKNGESVTFSHHTDFDLNPLEYDYRLEAEMVFAGYGIVDPVNGLNAYKSIDPEGKIVVILKGYPGSEQEGSPSGKQFQNLKETVYYTGTKTAEARKRGARGVLVVSSHKDELYSWSERFDFMDPSPSEGRPNNGRPYVRHRYPTPSFGNAFLNGTISLRAANEMLRESGVSLEDYIAEAAQDPETTLPQSNSRIEAGLEVETKLIKARNVVAMIEGEKKDEVMILGAHYDHTGMGNGFIWNGADDNGSGTVGIMTVAKALQATGKKPEKTILFALWSGEEKGLLGSRYYAEHPTVPLDEIKMNLNLDMIARYIAGDEKGDKVTMTYTSTKSIFEEITRKHIKKYDLLLDPKYEGSENPGGGSDHRAFTAKGIPIMRFKPGHREEYHTPYDELSTIDWPIMENIVKICFLNIWELANSEW